MRERTPQEYQAGNERALVDTARIEEIVAKMLTLARFESASLSSQAAISNLNECIRNVVSELETVAAVRQVRLTVRDLPSGASVPLSTEDCSIVAGNLIMNAIQHSPPQSCVEIYVLSRNGEIEFTVQDQGDGIDADVLPHVFERFYRADPSRARTTGGTGLGLAICKAAVERAGGSISLISSPGAGATATVRLPKT